MAEYHSMEQVIADRRKGVTLNLVVDDLLRGPEIWRSYGPSPFSLIQDLQKGDYVDMATPMWRALTVHQQMALAESYQWWYAHKLGLSNPFFDSRIGKMALIPPMKYATLPQESSRRRKKVILIKKPFWLGCNEITQVQWRLIMGKNPSANQTHDQLPVENVSWFDCQQFCKKTNTRLPDEWEWELACRAGTTTHYNFGDSPNHLEVYAWHQGNSDNHSHPVGTRNENAWGLYDMHGNVSEWCITKEKKYSVYGDLSILRGGNFYYPADWLTSSSRFRDAPQDKQPYIGFRIAQDI